MYFILKGANFSQSNIGKITVQEGTVGGGGGSSGGGSTSTYTFTINPTPSSATVKLTATGYTQSGNSITVPGGTTVSYTVSASGYVAVNGSKQVWSTQTLPVTLNKEGSSGGDTTSYTFTINPTPTSATVTLSATGYSTVSGTGSKSITVASGTTVSWSVSASGYTTQSGTQSVTSTSSKSVTLVASGGDATDTATLTVNPTPSNAKVTLYAKGYTQSGNSITVPNNGTVSPTYQVTKDNYLSQGGAISKIKSNQTLDITLQPFSSGNWTNISSTAEKVADYFVVDGGGKFNGPYTTWCHWIVPATPGKKYRITATAGQSARLWGFYTDKPVSDGSVKPISVSANNGMTTKIADEAVAPEGTVYLVVNNRISGSGDTKAIIEVLN